MIAVVAVVAGCIAAFAGRKNDTTGAKANDTVTIGLKLAPTNLDIRNTAGSAIDQVLIGNVYEGLVARDEHNQVVPASRRHGMSATTAPHTRFISMTA